MGGSDHVVDGYLTSGAYAARHGAGNALESLFKLFFSGSEPRFPTIASTYNRMLAIALLLAGAVVAMALIERMLGGPKGAGWDVLPRTLAAVIAAVVGLGLVEYAAHYANLLAHAWDLAFAEHGLNLVQKIRDTYQPSADFGQALGSALGLLLIALFTIVLVILIAIELVIRSALILITTAFLPLVCVMAIWPRLSPALSHLAEFMTALLLSKFVIITAVYIGFSMVADGYGAPKGDTTNTGGMVVGLATLLIALFSPIVLLQGIRFAHTAGASTARAWSTGGFKAAGAVAGAGLGRRLIGSGSRGLRSAAGRAGAGRRANKQVDPRSTP